ncbi:MULTISPECIES: plasmid partition protein ParG [unclassified Amycolatopsis]|uniref:plasmid partition protein ParG n=1 Tax=unclassified Amycolatopsis TaxID=2618356 RepID=UPI00287587BA|nr:MULTISPECIES: plasmid partition protein ParG [unclassified Amycolatopsis]MDS0140599.1 hypothetical protein [Amycolatopsis sp. 505]MDS0149249.1 hypothetical protein [Amycolatopsis sp. CM201R]
MNARLSLGRAAAPADAGCIDSRIRVLLRPGMATALAAKFLAVKAVSAPEEYLTRSADCAIRAILFTAQGAGVERAAPRRADTASRFAMMAALWTALRHRFADVARDPADPARTLDPTAVYIGTPRPGRMLLPITCAVVADGVLIPGDFFRKKTPEDQRVETSSGRGVRYNYDMGRPRLTQPRTEKVEAFVPDGKKVKFRRACTAYGTTMTDEINKFIDEWLADHPVEDRPMQEELPLNDLQKAS